MAVERNRRKTRVGMVISDKMDKTIVVAVEDFVRHSLYVEWLRVAEEARISRNLILKQTL